MTIGITSTASPAQRLATQQDTVNELEELGTEFGGSVEADPLPDDAHEECADDYFHGLGTVFFHPHVYDGGGLCPSCAVKLINSWLLVAGLNISVEVYR